MNMTVTDVVRGSLVKANAQYREEVITLTGPDTFLKGTLLARNSVGGKLVPMVVGGANGTDTPIAVLTYTITTTGAGDVMSQVMIAGNVRKDKLIIDADGTGANITAAHIESLRNWGIIADVVTDFSQLDNR